MIYKEQESPQSRDRVFCLEFNCHAIIESIYETEGEIFYDLRLERRKNQSQILVTCRRHDFVYPPPSMVNIIRRVNNEGHD